MARVFYDKDADLQLLGGKRIAIIGYGSQGHAQALNLKDSGLDVIVANRKGSANYHRAVAHGFDPVSAAEAAASADVIQMLVPDEVAAKVYYEEVAPHMSEGKALVFSHGFNIHYGQIVPPSDVMSL